LWCDDDVNVDWGFDSPILSEKDMVQPTFKELDKEELLGGLEG
jgi:dTDP-4-dehydrorhamnose 3,5-epimerase-like enzyme